MSASNLILTALAAAVVAVFVVLLLTLRSWRAGTVRPRVVQVLAMMSLVCLIAIGPLLLWPIHASSGVDCDFGLVTAEVADGYLDDAVAADWIGFDEQSARECQQRGWAFTAGAGFSAATAVGAAAAALVLSRRAQLPGRTSPTS